ncbi:uncharacterized protein LOC112567741 [Pomacea canaliculata]|uniref:uncharacterized protein LOC112567741 n=1 Tax=Pomacea canaliculata TaxID=400727 RepID=UPI000D73BE17|nr:uncharacterized protein LOC112567741 [Pomacea canaliculata]
MYLLSQYIPLTCKQDPSVPSLSRDFYCSPGKLAWIHNDVCNHVWYFYPNRYKAIVDSNKKTGQRRSRWNYYSRILEEDPSVIPPVTISSLGGVKVNILSEISNILQGATPTKEPYQEQQGISQETPVCRKRRRSNNELSDELQSYFERSLAIQAEMLVEERKRTEFAQNTKIYDSCTFLINS